MSRRDDNLALRSLTVAVEAHTELVRAIIGRLDAIDDRLGTLIDTFAEHVTEHHRGDP